MELLAVAPALLRSIIFILGGMGLVDVLPGVLQPRPLAEAVFP